MTAIGAIAVVPLRGHDRLHQIVDIGFIHIADGVGNPGKRLFLVVSASQTTARKYVETLQLTVGGCDDDQAHILRVEVNRVVSWHRNANFELTGHVMLAVNWLFWLMRNRAVAVALTRRCHSRSFFG